MRGSGRDGTADPAVISRRDAIIGALALAAGTLIASKPEETRASNGDAVTAGGDVYTSAANAFYLTSSGTNTGTELCYSLINRNGTLGDPISAFYGEPLYAAPSGSNGIMGEAWYANHTAVVAKNNSPWGTALKVQGRASFTRSGKATVAKKHSTLTVTVPSIIETTSMILVTLQGSGGSGVWLKYAKRVDATHFKVVLNKKTKSAVDFAWMIVD
jgi:hypothetical protein